MTEVAPKLLWIGNATEARQISQVLEAGVEALVDLALEERPPNITRDLIYCRFPLVDGGGNSPSLIRAAIECVVSLFEKRVPTFVCCGAGMSRSPAIVAAALAESRGGSLEEVLEEIVAGRPLDVSSALWTDIKGVCGG